MPRTSKNSKKQEEKPVRMTRADYGLDFWDKLRKEYITTDITLNKLHEKYNVSNTSLKKHMTKEGWQAERDAFRNYELAEADRIDGDNLFVETVKDAIKLISRSVNLCDPEDRQGIKWLTSSLRDLKDIGVYRAEMDRREQLARIKKLEREANDQEQNKEIVVRFEEEIDEYGD